MSDKCISSTNVNRMYFNKSHIQQLFVNPVRLLLEESQWSEVRTHILTYNNWSVWGEYMRVLFNDTVSC